MAERISLNYDPPGEQLRAFRHSNALARALIGPLYGGRKTCAVHDILLRAAAGSQRRWRWVAVRGDGERLESETIAAWQQWVPAALGNWDPKALRHQLGFAIAGKPRDIDIQFLALDRPETRRRLGAIEASGIWLDGARELDPGMFDLALERAGSWPLDEKAAPLVICTSRMPAADHWLLNRADLALFRQPGGRTPQAENLKHLKPGFYQRAAEGRAAEWIRAEIDAEPRAGARANSLEGLILASYETAA